MEERLNWIKLEPSAWLHVEPLRGGLAIHDVLSKRYPASRSLLDIVENEHQLLAIKLISKPWWTVARWAQQTPVIAGADLSALAPGDKCQMVWANMALHMAAQPQALIRRWHEALATDGFLMFSCLGPDTLKELRPLYAAQGWMEPAHAFTDMHDWGDMLVAQGFGEPVLDMERITLSYETPERLLEDLRGLGRNLSTRRFQALRGRGWLKNLKKSLLHHLADPTDGGRLKLTFEIIYGHAVKPARALAVQPQLSLSLEEMRRALKSGRPPDPPHKRS